MRKKKHVHTLVTPVFAAKKLAIECVLERIKSVTDLNRLIAKTVVVNTKNSKSKLEYAILKLEEYEDELAQLVVQLLEEIKRGEAALAELYNGVTLEVMKLRYIDNMKWEQISNITHYSISALYALHRRAVSDMRKA